MALVVWPTGPEFRLDGTRSEQFRPAVGARNVHLSHYLEVGRRQTLATGAYSDLSRLPGPRAHGQTRQAIEGMAMIGVERLSGSGIAAVHRFDGSGASHSIRIITDTYLRVQRLYKCKYEVLAEDSAAILSHIC